MVCIKANDEIVKVYQRIIAAMRERVEWNGDIIIRKNTMILVEECAQCILNLQQEEFIQILKNWNLSGQMLLRWETINLLPIL